MQPLFFRSHHQWASPPSWHDDDVTAESVAYLSERVEPKIPRIVSRVFASSDCHIRHACQLRECGY
nr:MAG TPA: hypothetical protein [Caudoviricetes sp.]